MILAQHALNVTLENRGQICVLSPAQCALVIHLENGLRGAVHPDRLSKIVGMQWRKLISFGI